MASDSDKLECEFLFGAHFFQDVYKAMEGDETDTDYLANVAMAAFAQIRNQKFPEAKKNISDSVAYRENGNNAYRAGLLQTALVNYNMAMVYAPHRSLLLKLAYSNRSAVLFTAKQYDACIKDCTTALAMDCPAPRTIDEKLERRKSQAVIEQNKSSQHIPNHQDSIIFKNYAIDYFKLKSQNDNIPCASADVDVIMESGNPKVIAKRDISAGTLLAVEKAFVSWAPEVDQYINCYYCRKLDLNLFPCNGCVAAMFCSKQCEETCKAEYHAVECQMVSNLNFMVPEAYKTWVVKAAIKLRNMCASWEELISLSYDYGYNKSEKKTVNEIFDGSKPSSLQSFKHRHFIHGAIHKKSLECGLFLNFMQNVKSFLPENGADKLLALKAMARIMMHLSLFSQISLLMLVTTVVNEDSVAYNTLLHAGVFPFIGKLKHSCVPNVQSLSVNNSMALIASEKIKAGMEFTVSHIMNWLDQDLQKNKRKMQMLLSRFDVCTCIVCTSSPEELKKKIELTTNEKKAIFSCFALDVCRIFDLSIGRCLELIYNALECLKNKRLSADYYDLFKMLKQVQCYMLHNVLHNVILSKERSNV